MNTTQSSNSINSRLRVIKTYVKENYNVKTGISAKKLFTYSDNKTQQDFYKSGKTNVQIQKYASQSHLALLILEANM